MSDGIGREMGQGLCEHHILTGVSVIKYRVQIRTDVFGNAARPNAALWVYGDLSHLCSVLQSTDPK